MKIRFTYWILALLLLHISILSASAQVTLEGYILSEQKKPLADCVVRSLLNEVSLSDETGRFTIRVKQAGDTLTFGLLGYKSLRLPVEYPFQGTLTVELVREDRELEEVVVSTGYFTLPKERITGSFEKINKDLIARSVSTNILDRLEGVSSILFDNRNGASGISIRGRSTIFANANPLIVVDGFPYEGDFNSINPNDIEHVTLLKDAAAASIWGARAANGVLVVETTKGRFNQKPQLQFTGNLTYGTMPDLYYTPAMTSADFIDMEKELFDRGYYNSTLTSIRYPVISPAVELLAAHRSGNINAEELQTRISAMKNHDVRKDLEKYFYRNSFNQQYSLSYRGGTTNYTYNLSAGFDRNLSEVKRNSNDRITLLSSATFRPVRKLLIDTQLGLTLGENFRNVNVNSITPFAKSLHPYAKLADEDGNALVLVKDHRVSFLDTAGRGRLLDWMYRPLDEQRLSNNVVKTKNLRANIGIKYNLTGELRLEGGYQYELQMAESRMNYSEETYTARNLINRYSQIAGNTVIRPVPAGGILDLSAEVLASQSARAQLHYDKNWKEKHSLTSVAGSEIRQSLISGYTTRTYGYNNATLVYQGVNYADIFPTYAQLNGNQRIINPNDFNERMNRFVSFYSNTAYTYFNRYSLSVSARKDASNLFGVEHNQKGVPLWSSGFSWDISKEPFFRSDRLKYLKTRLSYGVSGNIDNSLSALTTLAFYANNPITGLDYAMMRNPGNPHLRWERQYMLNAGVDFELKNNILSGTIDLFLKNGRDLIGDSPTDPTTGVTDNRGLFQYRGNVAHTRGYGLDATLNYSQNLGLVRINSILIFGYVNSKVTRYIPSSNLASAFAGPGTNVSPLEGKPVYSIHSYQWGGLDPNTGDPMGFLEGVSSKNYQAIMTSSPSTLVYHGSAAPVYFGSFRNTIEFKRWSASANLVYKLGYYFRRTSINYASLFSNWNHHSDFAFRWQTPGDEEITQVPSMAYPAVSARDAFYGGSEVLVERGDHIRFHDLNIGYQAGRNKKYHLYLYIKNLGMIWRANKVGLDPDLYNGGIPPILTFSLGFKTTI